MATEEILLKYKADITDLQAKVGVIEAQLKKTGKAFTDTGKAVDGSVNKISLGLKNLAAGFIAGFAVDRIIAFGKESVKAFQEAELNARKLQTAISVNGGLQKDFDNLIKQSEDLQRITIFSDDDIQRAQTAALQFGLTANEVERLIPIVTDFASATGQSLQQALDSVLRGLEGQARGLKIYGINIDSAASRAENLIDITGQLTSKFAGQAEIIGNTSAGAIAKYENQIDDLKEQLGEKLQPVMEAATKTALLFTEGIVASGEAINKLVVSIAEFLDSELAASNQAQRRADQFAKNVEASRKDTQRLIDSIADTLMGLSESELQQRFESYGRLLNQAQKEQKALTDAGKAQSQQLNQDIVTYAATRRAIEQVRKSRIDEAGAARLSADALAKLTTEQLKNKLAELKGRTDNTARDAVENIRKILEARKKAQAEESKQAAAFNEQRLASEKAAQEKIEQARISLIKDSSERQREQAQKDFDTAEADAQAQFKKGLISKKTRDNLVLAAFKTFNQQLRDIQADSDEQLLNDKLEAIDDATQKEITALKEAFNEKGDFSEQAQAELNAKVDEAELQGLRERLKETEKAGQDTIDISAQIANKLVEINKGENAAILDDDKKTTQELIANIVEVGRKALEVAEEINNINNAFAQSKIDSIESEQEAQEERFDREQDAIEEQVEKRIITEAQGEQRSADLKRQRAESEKKANEQVNAVRRKQAEASKVLAIFEATLNLAEAISVALSSAPPPFNATLAAISAALAGAQLAAIIATPVPKFFKGAEYVKRGLNPAGQDTIPAMLNEGERVVTTEKNLKHWDVYQAIDENRLDKYIHKTFVVPKLKEQQKIYEKSKETSFAESVGKSVDFSPFVEKLYHDNDYLRRKGVTLNNVKQIAKETAKEVSTEIVRTLIREGKI